jgi:hypothetical protein
MREPRWSCWHGSNHQGRRSTRQAAMNLVDKPFISGPARVRHTGTGEEWERRAGSWFKTQEPSTKRKGKAA